MPLVQPMPLWLKMSAKLAVEQVTVSPPLKFQVALVAARAAKASVLLPVKNSTAAWQLPIAALIRVRSAESPTAGIVFPAVPTVGTVGEASQQLGRVIDPAK